MIGATRCERDLVRWRTSSTWLYSHFNCCCNWQRPHYTHHQRCCEQRSSWDFHEHKGKSLNLNLNHCSVHLLPTIIGALSTLYDCVRCLDSLALRVSCQCGIRPCALDSVIPIVHLNLFSMIWFFVCLPLSGLFYVLTKTKSISSRFFILVTGNHLIQDLWKHTVLSCQETSMHLYSRQCVQVTGSWKDRSDLNWSPVAVHI